MTHEPARHHPISRLICISMIEFHRALAATILLATATQAETVLFQDSFRGKMAEGWAWVREHREGWRVTSQGLEIRVEPGNMWGPANNARNVLIRPVSDPERGEIVVSAILENHPTEQYEQIDLVWFYDDSHMVKIGLELVDGQLSLVMGREENDRTRTLAIIPMKSTTVHVRLRIRDRVIQGEYRANPEQTWRRAGECELPGKDRAFVSLQAYQGPADKEHWARIRDFRITRTGNANP